jgi:hypothetical protein
MKRTAHIVTLAALAALCSASAYAQPQRYDPAIPQGVQRQSVAPAGELASPAPAPVPPRLIQNRPRGDRDADARHCLERPGNMAVHRCSLPYRSRVTKRRAAVKTKAKAPAEPVLKTEPPKPAAMKPRAPTSGDAAKAAEIVKPMDVTKPGAGVSPPLPGSARAPAAKAPSGVPTPVTTPGQPAAKAAK